jgi:predicted GNAT family acetyltransferase
LRYDNPMHDAHATFAIRDNPEQQRFEVDLGDSALAVAQYELFPDRIVFTHTEVPPLHRGRGIGSALVRFALHSARGRGLKVVPVCPFFTAYLRKHAEEQDLLEPGWRKRLGLS